jgi:hypothetical protein
MRTDTIDGLASFPGRGAGTDAERRAALWLARQLRSDKREAGIETFWCRPNWAMAQAWHVALGLVGSLLAVTHPRTGAALLLAALLFVIADWQLGISPGRRLTPERASQNVVSPALTTEGRRVRLIVTANYDAGRAALIHRPSLRSIAQVGRAAGGRFAVGWVAWLVIALGWALVTALVRFEGDKGSIVGIAQLVPTIALVLALAFLLEAAIADYSPAASDNGSGVAVAIALTRALDVALPRLAAVEVVLTGAGDAQGLGLRRHLRSRRARYTSSNTVVLGIGACGAGAPRWWRSDGPLVPSGYFARLTELAGKVSQQLPKLKLQPHRGRGCAPALPARMRRLPAISIGCLDSDDSVPNSHLQSDTKVDPAALDKAVQTALLLVGAIDGYLATLPA